MEATPIPRLDTEQFRRKLVGLADPDRQLDGTVQAEIRAACIRFTAILASLFGDSLDRLTLWSRIGSAYATATAKVSDDDLDRFADLCLEHVRADAGQAAACDALAQMRQTWAEPSRPAEWRQAFIAFIRVHPYAVLTHGRAKWEQVKAKECEL